MNQTPFICSTCGTEYVPSASPPRSCPICEDERQYLNPSGQSWTTLTEIHKAHTNIIDTVAQNIYAIYTVPDFAIGQRAHLLITPNGNVLWDCIANLDAPTINRINELGGIQKIAISHPHYYTTMAAWSNTFKAPVYLHKLDEQWVARKDFDLRLWEGLTTELLPGVTLINCAGHFEGGAVLHYERLLLTGDVIQVAADRKTVSFMYSYPNYIPLNKKSILHIKEALNGFRFDALYGAFGRYIKQHAGQAFEYSINRYLKIFE